MCVFVCVWRCLCGYVLKCVCLNMYLCADVCGCVLVCVCVSLCICLCVYSLPGWGLPHLQFPVSSCVTGSHSSKQRQGRQLTLLPSSAPAAPTCATKISSLSRFILRLTPQESRLLHKQFLLVCEMKLSVVQSCSRLFQALKACGSSFSVQQVGAGFAQRHTSQAFEM